MAHPAHRSVPDRCLPAHPRHLPLPQPRRDLHLGHFRLGTSCRHLHILRPAQQPHPAHLVRARHRCRLRRRRMVLRLPALLASLFSLPVLFGLTRRLTQFIPAALGATLLLAVSAVHIGFSQQARGYTLLMLFCLLHAWALLAAIEQLHARKPPPGHEWLLWLLSAGTGTLAVFTLPSGAFFVGACAFSGAALIRIDLPRNHRHRAHVTLFLATVTVMATAALLYVPRLDDLYSHASRFGIPLTFVSCPALPSMSGPILGRNDGTCSSVLSPLLAQDCCCVDDATGSSSSACWSCRCFSVSP
jgi:hypothetical protein